LLDSTLHALADPTRRAILQRLARSEARVTDLAALFPISLNSVSKHIRVLERGRLVERRKVGREHILKFRPESLQRVEEWILKQQEFWRSSLHAVDALLRQGGVREEEQ
jgi:DNA-binding transcriptional ArsR family regulator